MTSAAVGKNQILLEYHNAWSDKSVEWDSSPCRQFNWYIHSPFSLTSKKKKINSLEGIKWKENIFILLLCHTCMLEGVDFFYPRAIFNFKF
jgi:hypothetical protein